MAHLEVFTYRRGAFSVARFDRMGNSQEPLIVKRATVLGFTLFFVSELRLYANVVI